MQRNTLIVTILGSLGALLLVASGILGWVIVPNIIEKRIKEEVRLVNNSETWNKWVKIPIPIYLKFYIFNVTIPDRLQLGEKPLLQEFGPYVYEEIRQKYDIFIDDVSDTITYKQRITYHFREDLSIGSENDAYTTVNTPFISIATIISSLVPLLPANLANAIIQEFFVSKGEGLLRYNVSVRDMIFDGMELIDVYKLINFLPKNQRPPEFEGNRFAYYRGKNNSDDGEYVVKSGIRNSQEFGKIVKWNGEAQLDWWKFPDYMHQDGFTYCNMINGTDGTIYPPFIEKTSRLDLFITDVCRSLHVTYDSEMEFKDIPGYKFTFPENFFYSPSKNPDNTCFCTTPPGNLIDICEITGAFRLFPCKHGAPIITTAPHFLDSDDLFLDRVSGMEPNRQKHETFVELEPNSGLALRISKKVQISLEMQPLPGLKYFENLIHYGFPVFYADEYAELDDKNADELKSMLITPLKIVNISKWVGIGVGAALIIGGAVIYFVIIR